MVAKDQCQPIDVVACYWSLRSSWTLLTPVRCHGRPLFLASPARFDCICVTGSRFKQAETGKEARSISQKNSRRRWRSQRRKSSSVPAGAANFPVAAFLAGKCPNLGRDSILRCRKIGGIIFQQRRNLPENLSSREFRTATAFSSFLNQRERDREKGHLDQLSMGMG